jgi:nitroreductase
MLVALRYQKKQRKRGVAMEFEEALDRRRSVRVFDGKPLDTQVIRKIVEMAGRAPSWANAQPWRVYVAIGDALARIRTRHMELVRRGVRGASDFENMHRGDWGPQAQRNMSAWSQDIFYGYLGGDPEGTFERANTRLFNASAVAYLTLERPYPEWGILDLGAFEQTFALAAANEGLDTMLAYELVKYPKVVRDEMGIPKGEDLAMGIALGRAADEKINGYRSQRMGLDEYLTIKA